MVVRVSNIGFMSGRFIILGAKGKMLWSLGRVVWWSRYWEDVGRKGEVTPGLVE